MSQVFKKGMPLVNGHGNLAPSKATRGRHAIYGGQAEKFAEEVYLKDLDKTVGFIPNYDETEKSRKCSLSGCRIC